ncbi:tyrosine-type recombinase/integrase [Deinococcus aquatilis]|uniref:tyrosine-type recombinase/integrase n=1 Tax=Deinococcus aquatilis TaxID=519440 RepID=UPI00036A750B
MEQAVVQREDTGLEKHAHSHLLRHRFERLMLDRGLPIDQVRKFLRYRNVATTQIYMETSTSHLGRIDLTALER